MSDEVKRAIRFLRSSHCPDPWFHSIADLIERQEKEIEQLRKKLNEVASI